jgi:uncharacterized protein (DUF488 family)
MRAAVYTVGHSIHPIDEFVELLNRQAVGLLVDVRSYPRSRRWPQFNQSALEASLVENGITYRWLKQLGGRRQSIRADSPHTAWTVAAFRAYSDYADGADFAIGLSELIAFAHSSRVAILCAEGLWWQCHRRIIADHLMLVGWAVRHIMPSGELVAHALPDFARIAGDRIIYDGGQPPLKLDS